MTCNSAPDVISGFTIVRNAVTLDYPIVPAIRSILELCDEVVVNVGKSDDDTRDVVAALGDPRIRILDSAWDFSRGSGALSHETNRAMAACRGERSEEHTSELQSRLHLVCRLLLEKKQNSLRSTSPPGRPVHRL